MDANPEYRQSIGRLSVYGTEQELHVAARLLSQQLHVYRDGVLLIEGLDTSSRRYVSFTGNYMSGHYQPYQRYIFISGFFLHKRRMNYVAQFLYKNYVFPSPSTL